MDSNASRSDHCPGGRWVGRPFCGERMVFPTTLPPQKINGWDPKKSGGFEHISPFPMGAFSPSSRWVFGGE